MPRAQLRRSIQRPRQALRPVSRVCDRGAGGSDGGAPGRGQLHHFSALAQEDAWPGLVDEFELRVREFGISKERRFSGAGRRSAQYCLSAVRWDKRALLPEKWRAVAAKRSSLPQVYMFIEQNDPFRMSTEDYERDTKL